MNERDVVDCLGLPDEILDRENLFALSPRHHDLASRNPTYRLACSVTASSFRLFTLTRSDGRSWLQVLLQEQRNPIAFRVKVRENFFELIGAETLPVDPLAEQASAQDTFINLEMRALVPALYWVEKIWKRVPQATALLMESK